MLPELPPTWQAEVGQELQKPYFQQLRQFVEAEQRQQIVYPPAEDIFAALGYTAYPDLRVVILGQDPYPGAGQAHGLCFSVPAGVAPPASLRNIFHELQDDLGCSPPHNGSLIPWATQGVLLLNTVLTVRAGLPLSHRQRGWERFTDALIAAAGRKSDRLVFLLWGAQAQAKKKLIDIQRHVVLEAAHPSPLSAWRGFFGSRPFSQANAALRAAGKPEIDWAIPFDQPPHLAR
jgi:uracil-DNA glycosylase